MRFKFPSIGPATLVAAAFIGPGTVTTCSLAGAGYGYALLWALLFSVIATIVLQEMAARLGIVGRLGLGEALRQQFSKGFGRIISMVLVISAIGIGNAAYETGNILGGALGIEAITGKTAINFSSGFSIGVWGPLIGLVAFALLLIGSYKRLEKVLIGLVFLMSIVFIITMVFMMPQVIEILKGLFVPTLPEGSLITVVALIGTTVVPYNLFLHAATVQEKWTQKSDLKPARKDVWFSILLGGIISMSIVITAAAAFYGDNQNIESAMDLSVQLQPILGNWAGVFMSVGLFSAGITSAITAPLATAYAICGLFGWEKNLKSKNFRIIWMTILGTGIVLSAIGLKPIPAILFAQAANGILLPVIAIYLLWTMNNKKILGTYKNRWWLNGIAGIVVIAAIFLGIKSLLTVIGWI